MRIRTLAGQHYLCSTTPWTESLLPNRASVIETLEHLCGANPSTLSWLLWYSIFFEAPNPCSKGGMLNGHQNVQVEWTDRHSDAGLQYRTHVGIGTRTGDCRRERTGGPNF